MYCKRCGRVLKSPASIEREMGTVCERKLQTAKSRYKPTELFPLPEYQPTGKQPVQATQQTKTHVFAYQIPMNFNPVIRPEMSMLEQHRAAMRLMNGREVQHEHP